MRGAAREARKRIKDAARQPQVLQSRVHRRIQTRASDHFAKRQASIMNAPQIVDAPKTYADEALEVIAGIMRNSQSEKTRLVAAAMLLEHGNRKPQSFIASGANMAPLEIRGDMRTRVLDYLTNHQTIAFDAELVKQALALKSPISAVNEMLVRLHKENAIERLPTGMYRSFSSLAVSRA